MKPLEQIRGSQSQNSMKKLKESILKLCRYYIIKNIVIKKDKVKEW